jgi:hypothetical protein
MSNTAALALVVASFFVGLLAYYIWTKWAHELAHEIITGVDGNTSLPLPTTWRWHLLQTRFIYIIISMSGSAALAAAVSFEVGTLASDPGTKMVAYLFAAMSALVAVTYPLHSALEFVTIRRLLRQAEAD